MRPPGFFPHLLLLWSLRLQIGLNRGSGQNRLMAVAAFVASSAPGLVLGVLFFRLLRWEPISASPIWCQFLLTLLGFVTSCTWTLWPLLSAGVDDHSELSRYNAFPISSFRLLVASTLASLLEPRALVFFAPVVGAMVGFLTVHPPTSWALVGALFVLYALMNAAWSRVGLHLVLNVLRQRRSAETIGGFFVLFLVAASFIPPIDTRWLTSVGGGIETVSADLIAQSAIALARVPPGFLGRGLMALASGHTFAAAAAAAGLVFFTALGMWIAWRLLIRFHQHTGRAGPPLQRQADRNPFAHTRSRFATLVAREAVDLSRNPRARLLAAVPFLLAILLKIISGRDLFLFLLGPAGDAWLMGALSLYGSIVIASTFSQNTFGYDGHGLAVFIAAPMSLSEVLRAKNLVHGVAGFTLALSVSVFYLVYFRAGSFVAWACTMAGVLSLLPVLLAAGNMLSLFFPVKFHASLKRRDKLPFAAAMIGVVAASVGALPFVTALRAAGGDAPGLHSLLLVSAGAVLAWAAYAATLPTALRLLHVRRERVLGAVTRE